MSKHTTISDAGIRLRQIPDENREKCPTVCRFILIEATDNHARWRCDTCLRYLETRRSPIQGQASLF